MIPLHALLFRLRVIRVYPILVSSLITLHCKTNSSSTVWLQIFACCFILTVLHFLGKHSVDPLCTDFYHQQMFAQDCVNGTSAHSDSYQLTPRFCSTVFSTARTASDRQPDWGLSSRLLMPGRNSAALCLTVAYDGVYPLQTSTSQLYTCCG